ncbi:MAG: 50S ribosomal protein L24e [Candidatus Caldarchaeales archaeon]|jgi:large subunit ribosomal protein L24e
MSTVHRCAFCGREFPHGVGMLYVKRDGSTLWFCSRKCRVYMAEQRKDPRKLKWTVAGSKSKAT